MTSILNSPIDDLINTTNNVLCSLVNSYKLVSNQHHSHKPTKIEKAFTQATQQYPTLHHFNLQASQDTSTHPGQMD